jgi:hypothetical protein
MLLWVAYHNMVRSSPHIGRAGYGSHSRHSGQSRHLPPPLIQLQKFVSSHF